MRTSIAASFCGLALSLLSCVTTYASDPTILAKYYGAGVHSYFGGSFAEAYNELSAAIKAGTDDPRTFYFRGLALLNMGRPEEATVDFKRGAELEAGDVSGFYQVGQSLKRVQGANRLTLEKYRNTARVVLQQSETNRRRARYETGRRNEQEVLRKIPLKPESPAGVIVTKPNQAEIAPGIESNPLTPLTSPAAQKAVELDPFREPINKGPAAATPVPPAPKAVTPPAESGNIFGDDPEPATAAPLAPPAVASPPVVTPPAAAIPPASAKTPGVPAPKPTVPEVDPFGDDPAPGPPAKETVPGERPNRVFEKETVPGERPNRILTPEPIPGERSEPGLSTSPAKTAPATKIVEPPPAIEPPLGSPAPATPKLGDAPKPATPPATEPNLFDVPPTTTTPPAATPVTPAPVVTPPATPAPAVTPPAAEPNPFDATPASPAPAATTPPSATPAPAATPPAATAPPGTTPSTPAPMPTPEPTNPFDM